MTQILGTFPSSSSAGSKFYYARVLRTEHSRFGPDMDSCREGLHEVQNENRPGSGMELLAKKKKKNSTVHEIQGLAANRPFLGVTVVYCWIDKK